MEAISSGSERLYLLHAGYEVNPDYETDTSAPRRLIHLTCKTLEGSTRLLIVEDWLPWIYVKGVTSDSMETDAMTRNLRSSGISSVEFVRRVQAVGFTNERQDPYAKVRVRKWPVWCDDQQYKTRLFENTIKPASKFYCETGLRSGAWFDSAATSEIITCSTSASIIGSRSCFLEDLSPRLEDVTPPRLTVMAYDLETGGLDPNTCSIYQCCCVFWSSDQPVAPDPRSVVICTQATAVQGDTRLIMVSSERQLLLQLSSLLRLHDVDILTGFNLTFDNGFLRRRLQLYVGMEDFDTLGRPSSAKSVFVVKEMKTAALGSNKLILWAIPGRVVIDLFLFAKANHPTLPDFKLNTCGEHFIGTGKDDVPFGTILESFRDESAVSLRGEVAKYCLQDGFLCIQLMATWCAHISCTEEASACAMNVGAVPDSGRQIKVLSLLLAEIHDKYVFNPPAGAQENDEVEGVGYEGATVIDTQKGFYSGPLQQVVLLDFSSLYPSLARAHRVSPERYVRKNVPQELAASKLPGVVVIEHHISATESVLLATPYPDPGKPYFYQILQKLLDERAAVRKLQKIEPDPAKKAILNARQLSKKVAANSAYGLLGCTKGYLPLHELAATITYQGRQALRFSQNLAEEKYGAFTVAGDTDSIMINLPAEPQVETPLKPSPEWLARRLRYVFEQGAIIGADVSCQLPEELEFELEGVMWPAAFYGKKKYAAVLYEHAEKPLEKLKIRGLVAIRNDWSLLTKCAASTVLRMGIQENDPEGAVAYLREILRKMRDHQLPMEQFVIKKQLHSLTPVTISPHVALCLRLQKSSPSDVPALGSKVEFVITRGHSSLSASSMRPCDAEIGQLDLKYYFERQLVKPLTELLAPLISGGEAKLKKLLLRDMAQHDQRTIYEMLGLKGPAELIQRPAAGAAAAAAAAIVSSSPPLRKSQTMFQALGIEQPIKRKAEGSKVPNKQSKQKVQSVSTFFHKL